MPELTIKYQGKIHKIQWDKPGVPTKDEVARLVGEKKEGVVAPRKEDDSYFGTLKDIGAGLLDIGGRAGRAMVGLAPPGDAFAVAKEVGTMAASPVIAAKDLYNKAEDLENRYASGEVGLLQGALQGVGIQGRALGEAVGIPVGDIGSAIGEGKYKKAAALSTLPVVGLAAGASRLRVPKGDIRTVPSAPRPIPEPTTLETPTPLVTTPESIIASQPFTEQINPQFRDLRHGLVRPESLTRSEQKALTQSQIEAVKMADEAGQKVKRPVVADPNIRPVNPIQAIVPDRLKEPGMNQVVFDALVPPDLTSRTKYKAPPKPKNVEQAAVKVISEINERVEVPPQAASQIVNKIQKDSWYRDVYDRMFTSASTQLTKLSKPLGDLVLRTRTEGNRLGGEYAARVRRASKGLSKEENLLAFRILDGTAKITDTTPGPVKAAVSKIRQVTEEMGDLAEASGAHIRIGPGESVPFKKMEGPYAHHSYPPKFFDDETSVVEQLMKQGKTAQEAQELLKGSRIFGERFISPTHAREFNVPGYIEDLSVMEKYAYDMGKRIVESRNFGSKDIGDKTSPLSKLIDKSSNPEKAHRLMTEYLDRGVKAHENVHKAAEKIVRAEVLTHLSLSAINQVADLAGVPVRTGFKNFANGFLSTLTNYSKSVDIATESGALAIMKREILKDISHGKVESFAFGLSKMEEVVRTVSAMSGRAAVQDLFNTLKKNPNNKAARKELRRLIDEDVDKVLQQDELTPKQISFGAGRTVELINSIPDKLSLPPAFTYHHPLVRLPLLFKRFAFTTTTNLAKAILQDPKRVIPAILSYGLIGEATGDIRETVRNLGTGDMDRIVDAVANRDKKTPLDTGNKMLNRALANLTQAWFLGLFGDIAEAATGGSRRVASFIGGPVAGDLYEAADAGRAALAGNYKPVKRAFVRRIPFIGGGLAEEEKVNRRGY